MTALFMGDRVRPTASKTINGGGAIWGWGPKTIGEVAGFADDGLFVRLPIEACPPGWVYSRRYDPETRTVVVSTDYGDLAKLRVRKRRSRKAKR